MNETVIHHAAWDREIQDDLFQDILQLCTDPNLKSFEDGKTPLHIATPRQSESKVNYLLEYGADPYIRDFNKNTSFETAMVCKRKGIFKMMIYKN